jgi:hypothetical protein
MTVNNHRLRLVGVRNRSTSPATLDDVSTLLDAPTGALVLIDGHAVERHGGWRTLARAIVAITTDLERDLAYCQSATARCDRSPSTCPASMVSSVSACR